MEEKKFDFLQFMIVLEMNKVSLTSLAKVLEVDINTIYSFVRSYGNGFEWLVKKFAEKFGYRETDFYI